MDDLINELYFDDDVEDEISLRIKNTISVAQFRRIYIDIVDRMFQEFKKTKAMPKNYPAVKFAELILRTSK